MVRFSTLDPSLWPRAVRALADLGFNAIDVPLVWREHERDDGSLDFTSPRLDVAAFLRAVSSAGLRAVVRLGPWPVSDVPALGIPDRVLHDRRCQARTRRQNPVYVLDLPGFAPLPSVASVAYREAAAAWITAAVKALEPALRDGTVARVIVGHGPPAILRDDAFEFDHHPDARGDAAPVLPPHRRGVDAALDEVKRQTGHVVEFSGWLVRAAADAGVERARIAVAIAGSVLTSPLACAVGATRVVAMTAPPPRAGVSGIWRQVRFACALGAGVHLDLRAGNPPFEPPTRATHTLQAARVAIAAGACDFTVQMGCAGDGWVGALLDERAEVRAHAARWSALLAWAQTLPEGRELGVTVPMSLDEVYEVRASTGVHPLPMGLLAWVGFAPEELTARDAITATRWVDAEGRLTAQSVPWRRALATGPCACDGAWADAQAAQWSALAPRVSPEGAALVRAVESHGRRALVVASAVEGPIRVSPPTSGRWSDEAGVIDTPRPLPGGEVMVLREVLS